MGTCGISYDTESPSRLQNTTPWRHVKYLLCITVTCRQSRNQPGNPMHSCFGNTRYGINGKHFRYWYSGGRFGSIAAIPDLGIAPVQNLPGVPLKVNVPTPPNGLPYSQTVGLSSTANGNHRWNSRRCLCVMGDVCGQCIGDY